VKLNVGTFEEGLIEGDSGNIHLLQLDEMILAVFAKSEVKMGMLEKSIRDFAMAVEQK
jgi:predicted regulator of Ras-like GTPase activity (Roadblock/LC7/MglB family)